MVRLIWKVFCMAFIYNNLRKVCMQTLQTLWRLRLGTERVRRRYGAGLVLIEELVNESYGFILLLVYDLGIYLCCGNARVPKQLAGGVYICPKCKHHRGEGMSSGMHNLSKSNGK